MKTKSQDGSRSSAQNSQNGNDKWAQPLESLIHQHVRWADVDPEDLVACLAAVTEDGAALLLSVTSDGGALLLQVLAGHSKPKWYAADMATLNAVLGDVTAKAKGR